MGHVRSDETVADALRASDAGMLDRENAALHGVSIKTIRRWRRDYQRRGKPRGQAHTQAPCPRCADGPLDLPSYAELFGWYLGDGHITRQRREVFALHIFDDVRYTGLNNHVMDLMRTVKPGRDRILDRCQVAP
jgi:hypothetical protein